MPFIWDYDINELKKTKSGRLLILERMINYGPDKGEKIKLSEVKKNWTKLHLEPLRKRMMELLIWGDFGYYPYQRVRKERVIESVQVDSLFDIAINKLSTILQRSEVKDFVDLYFLLQEFTVWDLMEGVGVKFRIKADPYLVGINCLKMENFDQLPKMLKPLNMEELKGFYRNLAGKLGGRVVKK